MFKKSKMRADYKEYLNRLGDGEKGNAELIDKMGQVWYGRDWIKRARQGQFN